MKVNQELAHYVNDTESKSATKRSKRKMYFTWQQSYQLETCLDAAKADKLNLKIIAQQHIKLRNIV